MKKSIGIRKILIVLLFVTALACCLTGCSLIRGLIDGGSTFSVNADKLTLQVGETFTVELASGSIKEDFRLSTSDESKVKVVDNTKLLGVDKTVSAVTVTATSDSGKTDVIEVTVNYADLASLDIAVTEGDAIQLLTTTQSIASVTFTAATNEGVDPNALFSWSVKDGDTEVGRGTGKTFEFTPPSREVTYTVIVSSGNHNAEIECGAYNSVYIYSNKNKHKAGTEIILNVSFLLPTGYNLSTVPLNVSVDGESIGTQNVQYTGTSKVRHAEVSAGTFDTVGDYEVVVTFQNKDSNTLTVTVANFVAVDHIEVSVTSGSLSQRSTASAVGFAAELDPVTADENNVLWYVNDELKGSGRTFSYTPASYGEHHVQAVADKVEGPYLTIVYLPQTSDINDYLGVATNYGGYPQNYYITNQRELNNIIVDGIERLLYDEENPLEIYIDFDYGSEIKDELYTARMSSVEAGIIPGYSTSLSQGGKVLSVTFDYEVAKGVSVVNSPTEDAEAAYNSQPNLAQSSKSPSHYPVSTAKVRNFYIDTRTQTMQVSTSNMLYKAVAWGYKPVFSGARAATIQSIYTNARDILTKICTDDMTDYEKVHAIYDWIVYGVRYDFDLSAYPTAYNDANVDLNNRMKFYGYYLEGIFLNGFYNTGESHAVCDGKSKAFTLLCGIEGISSQRVSGYAATGEWQKITTPSSYEDRFNIFKKITTEEGYYYKKYADEETYDLSNCYVNTDNGHNATGGHAWNKVLLDIDDDGYKEWFVLDTTWGDRASGDDEYLSHAYFLIRESDICDTHIESEFHDYPQSSADFNYYAAETFVSGNVTCDLIVEQSVGFTSESPERQLGKIIAYMMSNGCKYIEVELTYDLSQNALNALASSAISYSGYSSTLSGYSATFVRGRVVCVVLS